MEKQNQKWIVYVSTFPPRECGIATFTQDLVRACNLLYLPQEASKVIAMERDESFEYDPKFVIGTIKQSDRDSYIKTAEDLNKNEQVAVVSVQHEFGIFGGKSGSYIVDFLNTLKKPVVLTMHTVLPIPSPIVKKIVKAISSRVEKIIVMTETSKAILISAYKVPPSKIAIIPHGIHPRSYGTNEYSKKKLGLSSNTVLTTFGLLSPGKGIEYAVEALPAIISEHPDVKYLIVGATHPVVLKEQGDDYRKNLEKRATELGISNNVVFVNKYVSTEDLLEYLSATDIYLSLSQNPDQAVSGTLSYALGAGRPVISTAFSQAKEFITNDVGKLVDFKNSKQISGAVNFLLSDPANILQLGKNAYFKTRSMTWPNVALSYMSVFMELAPVLQETEHNLPPIILDHFKRMTDDFGILQFAELTRPDSRWGYTLDDNARALVCMIEMIDNDLGSEDCVKLAEIYSRFIEYTQYKDGTFYNYVDYSKRTETGQNQFENLEEANARAIFACAKGATSQFLPIHIKEKLEGIFLKARPFERLFVSPRSKAYITKAATRWLREHSSHEAREAIRREADALVSLYEENQTKTWHWFEDSINYSNGIIPESLIYAAETWGDKKYLETALITLEFLMLWSFQNTLCVPVGRNGWYKKGGQKHIFDQQPEEVASLVRALRKLYLTTKNEKYKTYCKLAFKWFLGNNILRQVVYDFQTGGSYDGIGEKEINLNQGAESTVTYLLARLAVDKL